MIAYLHNMRQKKNAKIKFISKKMKFKLFEITLKQKIVCDSKISKKLSYNQCQMQTKNQLIFKKASFVIIIFLKLRLRFLKKLRKKIKK